MKYGDVILVFLGIISILSVGYTLSVDQSFWYLPVIFFAIFIVMFYLLKIQK